MDTNTLEIQSKQLSLLGLVREYGEIVIPIIQRDYAQGRKDEAEIRDTFLRQLRDYLRSETSFNDLDFVYGNKKNSSFIPLDGQQRLTTLFLLHFYLANHDGKEALSSFRKDFGRFDSEKSRMVSSKFRYQTRSSSGDFCDALLNYDVDFQELLAPDYNEKEHQSLQNELSKTIRNYGWFFTKWGNDPTVDSMLRMLDAIHHEFLEEPTGYYAKLTSEEAPSITFHVLPLSDNGLNDDLYIKMNSRGLPLTRFEKIKARINQRLSELDETKLLQRTQEKEVESVHLNEYFSFNADTVWSYMFWAYKQRSQVIERYNEEFEIYGIDTQLLRFISAVAANYQGTKGPGKDLDLNLLDKADSRTWASFGSMDDGFFKHLIDVFDVFALSYDETGIHSLCDEAFFDVELIFKSLVTEEQKEGRVYDKRVELFAYYTYIIANQFDVKSRQDDFRYLTKVVNNLVEHNRFDSENDFCNSLKTIQILIEKAVISGSVVDYLSSPGEKDWKGFNSRQGKEECIKAWLIHNNAGWADRILQLEAHPYLKGQIISVLNLSGIEEVYDNINSNMIGVEADTESYFAPFDKYSGYIFDLFDKNGLRLEYEEEQIFRRALLSYGDYSLDANSNKSFLNNGDRYVSWRRFLRLENAQFNVLRDLLSNVSGNMHDYLLTCVSAVEVKDYNDWRGMLISTPEIWGEVGWNDAGSRKYLRFSWNDSGIRPIYLIEGNSQRMSGAHYELRSLYEYYVIKKSNLLAEFPNAKIEVIKLKGTDFEPYFRIMFKSLQFCVYYNYDGSFPWRIEIWAMDKSMLPEDVIAKAVACGYDLRGDAKLHADKRLGKDQLASELFKLVSEIFQD